MPGENIYGKNLKILLLNIIFQGSIRYPILLNFIGRFSVMPDE